MSSHRAAGRIERMGDDGYEGHLSFLGGRLPASFERRELWLPPGRSVRFEQDRWSDALVVIARGEVQLECLNGSRHGFGCGDVLWLDGLPLRALHNHGAAPVLLVAISRRRPGIRPRAMRLSRLEGLHRWVRRPTRHNRG